MIKPQQILDDRRRKVDELKRATREKAESHVDHYLEQYYDGEYVVVPRFRGPEGVEIHEGAIEELLDEYKLHGWNILRGDNHWLFLPCSLTPSQIDEFKEKANVLLWRGQ